MPTSPPATHVPATAIHSLEEVRLPGSVSLIASLGLEQVVPVGRPLSWSTPLRRESLVPPTPMATAVLLTPPAPVIAAPAVKKKPKMLTRLFEFLHPHHHEHAAVQSPVILRSGPGHGHGTLVKLLELLHLRTESSASPATSNSSQISNGLCLSDDEMAIVKERIPLIEHLEDLCFQRKYRFLESNRVIGKGASGVVRLACRLSDGSAPLAAKEFRRRRKGESACEYVRKLTAEFAIASRLHHPHVVETFDMVHDGKRWLEVMEWCSGGDLFAAIQSGKIGCDEIDSCFKQLVLGVNYLHSLGVAHRDLKPENLLIDRHGWLKITDFGVSGIFRSGSLDDGCECCRLVGVCGSSPYIAPEEYLEGVPYDPRPVDIWSCGIILLAMTFHTIPWEQATTRDPNYRRFIEEGTLEPFDRMATGARRLVKRILVPDPAKRISLEEIMADPWFKAIQVIPLPGADCPNRNDHLID